MKSISGKQLARILEAKGWSLKRIKGSHHIYEQLGSLTKISIPIHGNQDLKIGLLRYFMKQANLTENDLE